MDESRSNKPQVIQAAGGILWRQVNGNYEIAIVHRRRYNDWTLPKGKLQAGETLNQAALREVKEETGYTAHMLGFAGAISYETNNGTKVVCFWHMLPQGEPSKDLDTEVAEVIWLQVGTAREKLQYPLEKTLVAMWQKPNSMLLAGNLLTSEGSKLSRFRRWGNSIGGSSSKRRLERDLALSQIEIRSLGERDAQRDANADWIRNSLQLLQRAEDICKYGAIDDAWNALKAARRWSLYGLFHQNKTLFDSMAQSIHREGTAKKIDSEWRKDVIRELLSEGNKEFTFKPIDKSEDIGKVFWAQQVLDDYQNSAYEKMYIFKKRLSFLNIAAFLTIPMWIIFAPQLNKLKGIGGNMPFPILWLLVVLSGITGAIFSGFVRSFGNEIERLRIPNQIAESYISYARLFVGAISAIGATTLLSSGLIQIGSALSLGLVLSVAFISGFTEKLLQNAIDKSVTPPQKSKSQA
jgi:8-oxo-dGTP pyrophosphatase MutT (NUDIX family)